MNAKSSHAAEILIQGPPAILLAINNIPMVAKILAKIPFHHLPVANSLLLASSLPALPISRLTLTLALALARWLCFHFNARHRIPYPSDCIYSSIPSGSCELDVGGKSGNGNRRTANKQREQLSNLLPPQSQSRQTERIPQLFDCLMSRLHCLFWPFFFSDQLAIILDK